MSTIRWWTLFRVQWTVLWKQPVTWVAILWISNCRSTDWSSALTWASMPVPYRTTNSGPLKRVIVAWGLLMRRMPLTNTRCLLWKTCFSMIRRSTTNTPWAWLYCSPFKKTKGKVWTSQWRICRPITWNIMIWGRAWWPIRSAARWSSGIWLLSWDVSIITI